jgi:lipopolysaccharide/colanic/teichoic acid biosynthesis glycosyltransferase
VRRCRAGIKRAFDVALSSVGLIASSPLWLLIAAAIKIEDGGPVFFTQPRVGRAGVPFQAFKFRSMVVSADSRTALRAGDRDPRVTRVGAILRATAMDELPQLWNILRGDMSFVGPRPLMPGEIEARGNGQSVPLEAIAGYDARHSVRPGLTGLTQVYASRDIRRAHKFRLDLIYVRHASLWLDVRLVVLSFWITFRGRWEHRGSKL